MTCGTTETDSARISSIRLYFAPRQLLTPDSVLGKAMTAKYGKPSQVNEPEDHDPAGGGSLRWFNADLGGGGPQASADCSGTGKKQCQLTVEDDGLVAMERAKQAKLDKQRMHDSQPKAAAEL
jgi:hypothetical protein